MAYALTLWDCGCTGLQVALKLKGSAPDGAMTACSCAPADEVQRLQTELAEANASVEQMVEDLHAWEAAVAARDAELVNLQVSSCGCGVWQHGALSRPVSRTWLSLSSCQSHVQICRMSVHGARDSDAASSLAAQFLGMHVAPVLPLAASGRKAMHLVVFFLEGVQSGLHTWLQTALGELTFESEAAERLRGELRAAERQQGALQQQVTAAQAAAEVARQAEREARAEAEEARRALQLQSDSDRQLQVWLPVHAAAFSCAEPLLASAAAEQPSSC